MPAPVGRSGLGGLSNRQSDCSQRIALGSRIGLRSFWIFLFHHRNLDDKVTISNKLRYGNNIEQYKYMGRQIRRTYIEYFTREAVLQIETGLSIDNAQIAVKEDRESVLHSYTTRKVIKYS